MLVLAAVALVAYGLLLIPEESERAPEPAARDPFVWRQDQLWEAYQQRFEQARTIGCSGLADALADCLARTEAIVESLGYESRPQDDPLFVHAEREVFETGVLVAACPETLPRFVRVVSGLRAVVKRQSQRWQVDDPATRARLYRLLYGARAALEEAMLQAPPGRVPEVVNGEQEPSATPHTRVLGVTIHSGDVLVSRGGAPTSALIARGNDYPGNFSHVALVHVDARTSVPSIIEAHIERGVAVASLEEYLADVKLRVMVLRPRSDLPQLTADPLLPQRVAEAALERARTAPAPYDFALDDRDDERVFCSEVVSAAYKQAGVSLWSARSTISSAGVAGWLAAFGVRHFDTIEPSDLEYDPQLRVVAEWRNPEVLLKDHVDNAVIDAMLERANNGAELDYDRLLLPFARVAKAYSVWRNRAGRLGPIPAGMSATAALRNRWLSETHRKAVDQILMHVAEHERERGFRPPYWQLVTLARAQFAKP